MSHSSYCRWRRGKVKSSPHAIQIHRYEGEVGLRAWTGQCTVLDSVLDTISRNGVLLIHEATRGIPEAGHARRDGHPVDSVRRR
jgi:hypothetical protein